MTAIPKIGETAPNFAAKDQHGKTVSLTDKSDCAARALLKADRWLVLYFYPKDNTPGCTTEAKDFSEYNKQFQELGADVIGVSPDSEKSHCKFIDKHSLSIQLLSDPEHQVIEAYGAWRLKKFMGKEYMGVVRSTFLISPDGKIAQVWDQVRVKGHVEKVLQQLQKQVS
jgi:peroxiredoxin Q/BCP